MISGRGIVKIVERKLFTTRVTLKRNESEQENARRYISSRTGPSEVEICPTAENEVRPQFSHFFRALESSQRGVRYWNKGREFHGR